MMEDKFKETFDHTLDHLRKLCSMREYCLGDIRKKATSRLQGGFEGRDIEADVERILETLQKEGFLNQSRYAAAFARDKSGIAGWGPLKIRNALAAKGIDRETIGGALAGIDSGKAEEKLLKALQTKAKSLKDDPQIRLKLLKFGLSRGYDYGQVQQVVSQLL